MLSHGYLAQLGEHLFDVQKVGGSIPSVSTNLMDNDDIMSSFYFHNIDYWFKM